MKKFLLYILAFLACGGTVKAADGDLFPYPKVPDDITNFTERCDFIVTRFWAPANIKASLSKMDKLKDTFNDWVALLPYATADSVHVSIDRLLKKVEKSGPETLALARLAEAACYTDTSEIYSEEIYLPFARAAAEHKKISGADRARFQSQVRQLENSSMRGKVKWLEYVTPDGQRESLDSVHTQAIVLLFNDYDCDDCSLARIRLSADINATQLIKRGILTVISIQPGEASTEWLAAAADYPKEWKIGASEQADEYFNLRFSPSIYLLDARHRVLAKDIEIDGLLAALQQIRQNAGL